MIFHSARIAITTRGKDRSKARPDGSSLPRVSALAGHSIAVITVKISAMGASRPEGEKEKVMAQHPTPLARPE